MFSNRRDKFSNRNILLLFVIVYIVLGLLPAFDYHRLLLPDENDALMHCKLVAITTENNITEIEIGHVLLSDNTKLYLYTTTILREMSCHSTDSEPEPYLYRDIYLNISHIDINREISRMRETHVEEKELWLYDSSNTYLLRGFTLDRFGFSPVPIDPYRDFWTAFVVVKLFLLIPTIILLTLIYSLMKIRSSVTVVY